MSDTLNYCEECHIIFEDWVLQYHEYPTQCPSCRRDDLISFNSADIDILDRIDNPIEGDEWETAASGEITRLRADNAKLRAYLGALVVMLDEVNTHIDAAHNHLETADFILDTHELYCTAPKWDGPDTVRESEL